MKFIVDDTLESLIQRIAGPVEIVCKDKTEYTVTGIPDNIKDEVRAKIKAYVESRGKVFNEIE